MDPCLCPPSDPVRRDFGGDADDAAQSALLSDVDGRHAQGDFRRPICCLCFGFQTGLFRDMMTGFLHGTVHEAPDDMRIAIEAEPDLAGTK